MSRWQHRLDDERQRRARHRQAKAAHRLPRLGRHLTERADEPIGGIAETQEMLDRCAKHGIVSDIEVIPMQKINEAYERVVESDVRYRFVIDMTSL